MASSPARASVLPPRKEPVINLYHLLNGLLAHVGLELRRSGLNADFGSENSEIIRRVQPYTMTTPERIFSLLQATKYVAEAGITGDFVECGVWRGGSMMAAALQLQRLGRTDIDLHLFDTYEGMSEPTAADVDYRGAAAASRLSSAKRSRASEIWAYAPLDEVRRNLTSTGYPQERIHLVKGKVENTLPGAAPQHIALLRLDTDWYESTKHELETLYPRLVSGGVLLIDDYGYWQGSRKAFDEYAAANGLHVLLNRIDSAARIAVKP
ncbi:MAG TPA: TylF/MycF/NovP-related O-methyltransferase [Dehalococcoidia bacterium]|nr:TylF/MycF/NovP-related O-methyltransferase [Dehalococcoidia bacterium]